MFLRYLPHAAEPPAPLAGGRAAAWDLNPGRGPVPAPVAPAPRPLLARGGATTAPVRLTPRPPATTGSAPPRGRAGRTRYDP